MHVREPSSPVDVWAVETAEGPLHAPTAEFLDLSDTSHEAAALLREPHVDRLWIGALAASALAASFVLGWAGGLNWTQFFDAPAAKPMVQKEAAAPRLAEIKPSTRTEVPKRVVPAPEPSITGSIPKTTANPRPLVLGAAPTTLGAQAAALTTRPSLASAPETRPSTVPGWSVVEVRDGMAVLEGPEGIRTAARGDLVPGLGRVDSIVRWGNRWVVATASGLVTAP